MRTLEFVARRKLQDLVQCLLFIRRNKRSCIFKGFDHPISWSWGGKNSYKSKIPHMADQFKMNVVYSR